MYTIITVKSGVIQGKGEIIDSHEFPSGREYKVRMESGLVAWVPANCVKENS